MTHTGMPIVASFVVEGSEQSACPSLTGKMDPAGLVGIHDICGSPKKRRTESGMVAHGS